MLLLAGEDTLGGGACSQDFVLGQAPSWHARECARLSKRGRPPSAADDQIAAVASANDLVLVTANVKDFRRFKDLAVEHWSRGDARGLTRIEGESEPPESTAETLAPIGPS